MAEPAYRGSVAVIPVRKRGGSFCALLGTFKASVQSFEGATTLTVIPDIDEGISYLKFATQLYSKLVVYGKPCLDVVILRTPHLATYSRSLATEQVQKEHGADAKERRDLHRDYGDEVSVDAKGYKFGDGSPEFYDKYAIVAVGGTFDRLHAGHRLLLTAAAWASRQTLRLGITSDSLLLNKTCRDIIANVHERGRNAEKFARRVKPSLPSIVVTQLTDPAGPSATDPAIEALVVSTETATGAREINKVRVSAGLRPMAIIEVDVLDTQGQKLSSSALREAEAAQNLKHAS